MTLKHKWDYPTELIDDNNFGAASLILGVAGFFLGMGVSMILDIATGMPTFAWAWLWVAQVILPAVFFPIAYLTSVYRGLGSGQRRAMHSYLRLDKDNRKALPKNLRSSIPQMAPSDANALANELDGIYNLHQEAGNVVQSEKNRELLAAVRQERETQEHVSEKMKELL